MSHGLSLLSPLRSDLITLQECRRPAIDSASVIWRGTDPRQGVAVVSTEAAARLEFVEIPKLHPTVVPVRVQATQPFVFVGVWTHPPYNAVAWAAMTVCRWSRPATSIARQACRASSATPSGSCSACGILGGRLEAPGLWILPEAWKTPLHSRDTRALGARVSHPSLDGASAAHRLHRPSSLFVHVHHNE